MSWIMYATVQGGDSCQSAFFKNDINYHHDDNDHWWSTINLIIMIHTDDYANFQTNFVSFPKKNKYGEADEDGVLMWKCPFYVPLYSCMVPLCFKKINALQCSMVFQVHQAVQWTPKPCFERCGHLVFNARGEMVARQYCLFLDVPLCFIYVSSRQPLEKKKRQNRSNAV